MHRGYFGRRCCRKCGFECGLKIIKIEIGGFKKITYIESEDLSIEERKKVEEYLTKEGYTQDEIAKYIGMSQSTISLDLDKIEKEKRLK